MVQKLIPIHDVRKSRLVGLDQAFTLPNESAGGQLHDVMGRRLHDLRISVTDRCNFRCVYCMPKRIFDKNYAFLPRTELLSFEEITRIAKLFIEHGVEKIRLTGGEPLLRKNLEKLIEMLSVLPTVSGNPLDLTLTTNGSLLAKKAQSLKDAGLNRLTVSLDALDETIFQRMNDVDFPVSEVLNGLEAADRVGLSNIKINMVVKSGMNDSEILPMAHHFRHTPFLLRFIEYMDVGATNGWRLDEVVSSAEIVRRIRAEIPLQEIAANYIGETARRWQYVDGSGEIGVISSVSQAFCGDCTRARISTEGKLFTCLFATGGFDLRALIRRGCDDIELSSAIAQIWRGRSDRYSESRAEATIKRLDRDIFSDTDAAKGAKVEMSYIGG
jgi:cyclic pyranopterin phosphate synthase